MISGRVQHWSAHTQGMSTSPTSRQPSGRPTGGQFAPKHKPDSGLHVGATTVSTHTRLHDLAAGPDPMVLTVYETMDSSFEEVHVCDAPHGQVSISGINHDEAGDPVSTGRVYMGADSTVADAVNALIQAHPGAAHDDPMAA